MNRSEEIRGDFAFQSCSLFFLLFEPMHSMTFFYYCVMSVLTVLNSIWSSFETSLCVDMSLLDEVFRASSYSNCRH